MELLVSPDILIMLFVFAIFAGFIDSIAGGGGLISIPALFWAGLTPIEVIGTSKLQSTAGSGMASYRYAKQGFINFEFILPALIIGVFSSMVGAFIVQSLDPAILEKFIPILLILISIYFLFSRKMKPATQEQLGEYSEKNRIISYGLASVIGIYDGIFGPGTGSFMTIGFVALSNFAVLQATAHTKILNFATNVGALILFIVKGHIVYSAGLAMACGQLIGGYAGSNLAISKGTRIIRPLLVIVSLSMTLSLLIKG